jgi:effector-binding domain-containing protein
MFTEPKVEHHNEQPYMGIRTQVPMRQMGKAIRQLLRELFAWLEKEGVAPAGPPFNRFHVIDMAKEMDIELGVPVASALPGNDRIRPGVLPAGEYASLVYTGVKNGIKGNGRLLEWVASKGLVLDRWDDVKGDAFGGRYESFLTDPAEEPDRAKWDTEVAMRLADNQSR